MQNFFLIVCLTALSLCRAQPFEAMGKLPLELHESSGLVKLKDGRFISINDSGNEPYLYIIQPDGSIHKNIYFTNGNTDWEALAIDENQFYGYIGDFGNNKNKRQNLKILRFELTSIFQNDTITAHEISFTYPEQKGFPPTSDSLFFDAEALIVSQNQLLIITKNRKEPFDGQALVYSVPNRPGTQQAQLIDKLFFPGVRFSHWVTDASLQPQKNRLAVLGGNRVYLFLDFPEHQFAKGAFYEVELPLSRQFEGITWGTDTTLIISCETSKLGEASLFQLKISELITNHDSLRRAEVSVPEKVFLDTLAFELSAITEGLVYYELFDTQGTRLAYGKVGYFEKGNHQIKVAPNTTLLRNGGYLLNVIVGDRPHGFFVNRHDPAEVPKALEELQKHIKK